MKTVKLTPEYSETLFYNSLCNAIGTNWMDGYGLELTCDRGQYKNCAEHLKRINPNTVICHEDILMQVLRDGGSLTFVDHDGDGEYTRSITLKDVHEKVQNIPESHLADALAENDDVITADVILQTVFFDHITFG